MARTPHSKRGFSRAAALSPRHALERLEDRRLLSAGFLDPTFGTAGQALADFGNNDYQPRIALQPDGKILLAGTAISPFQRNIALARFNPNGTPDTSFGYQGRLTSDLLPNDGVLSLALDSAGILVGGYHGLARYTPQGTLDTAFATAGRAAELPNVMSLALDSQGRILAASFDGQVRRYLPNGAPDPSFAAAGRASFPDLLIWNIALDSANRLYAAGVTADGSDFALARLNASGAFDTSFGIGGFATTDFDDGYDEARALAIDPEGNILVGGSIMPPDADTPAGALARYTSAGRLDPSFANAGTLRTDLASGEVRALDLDHAGNIIVATDSAVLRYTSDGQPDPTFGSGGVSQLFSDIHDLALDADGDVLLAGQVVQPGGNVDLYASRLLLSDNTPPQADPGGPYVLSEGGSLVLDASATLDLQQPDNTQLLYEWDLNNDGLFETTGMNPVFSAQAIDGADPATEQTLTLRVTDAGGLSSFATTTLRVENAPPTIGSILAPTEAVFVGASIQAEADVSDPAAADTHTALWSWGDGSTTTGSIASGRVSGTHQYAQPGSYTLTLTVHDDDGGQAQTIFQSLVVIAPTPEQLTEALVGQVQTLLDSGQGLTGTQADSLLTKLDGAMAQMTQENAASAINKLQAFENQITAFLRAGKLTDAQGDPLLEAAQQILDALRSP